MNDTMVTLVGNAATAVEHRQTAAGVTVSRFRLAATSRRWDKAQERWTDGETSFYTVRSWRGLADNVAASVAVGEPLIVQGRLRLREGEQPPEKGGQRWFSAEVDAVAIGHDLTRGTAAFRRVLRAVRTGADGTSAPAQQPSPAPEAPTASEPSPSGQLSSAPAPPAQQDLWESPLPEAGARTTPKAPTAANSPTANNSPTTTNSPINSPTDTDPPTDAKARTAGEARPPSRTRAASRPRPASKTRTGARARTVRKDQTAARVATTAKTPATSGIAAGGGSPGDSAASSSCVPHSPGKVSLP